jgi:ankyrin repeat protein
LIAASRNGFNDICRLLVSAGANRALRNRDGTSAADAAASRGFTALAQDISRKT